jgi:ELWxxDGT repeat protein
VKDIRHGSKSAYPSDLTNVNGTLFFTVDDGVHGDELWKSDGTASGTMMVRDIRAGPRVSDPFSLTAADATLFFTARDGVHGRELWSSDGTASGTAMVMDLYPGPVGALHGYGPTFAPVSLTSVGGSVFFVAIDGPTG